MRRRNQLRLTAGVAAAASFLLATGAQALWSAQRSAELASYQAGAVAFGVDVGGDPVTRDDSVDGAPVTVTVPGSEIIKVLDQSGLEPEPLFWRFRASGAALGIAGMTHQVTTASQVWSDGSTHDVSSGFARENTVLAGSTVTIYPADARRGCSAVPPTPAAGEGQPNVHLHPDPVVLQEPGTNLKGLEVEQEWCVALRWNHDPDGRYVNDVQVTATAEDGTDKGAMAQWRSAVAFPPALNPLGSYVNRGSVAGTGEDLSVSRDHDEWHSVVYPDPSGEPALVLRVQPVVTNANPEVQDSSVPGATPDPS
nr:hypothetical protein [Cellulomonas hominis]